ncbi:hypothetical protein V4C53_16880 [Paraburkholderia azotifigens]
MLSIDEQQRQKMEPPMHRHLDGFEWVRSAALTVSALTGIPVSELM